jgi:hypothetical protein
MRLALKASAIFLAVSLLSSAAPAQSLESTRAATRVNTAGSAQFLTSLAGKFGTSVSQLRQLLSKIPPHGKGLNFLELLVISSRLGLSPDEKAVLKSRIGSGGTGFTREDVVGMGTRLGLNSMEIGRLGEQLGLTNPTIANQTLSNNAVIDGTADDTAPQPIIIQPQPGAICVPGFPTSIEETTPTPQLLPYL